MLVRKFAERGGALYFAEDYDDLYEVCATWGLFYAIGGDESVLDLALQQWNASTRISWARPLSPLLHAPETSFAASPSFASSP